MASEKAVFVPIRLAGYLWRPFSQVLSLFPALPVLPSMYMSIYLPLFLSFVSVLKSPWVCPASLTSTENVSAPLSQKGELLRTWQEKVSCQSCCSLPLRRRSNPSSLNISFLNSKMRILMSALYSVVSWSQLAPAWDSQLHTCLPSSVFSDITWQFGVGYDGKI